MSINDETFPEHLFVDLESGPSASGTPNPRLSKLLSKQSNINIEEDNMLINESNCEKEKIVTSNQIVSTDRSSSSCGSSSWMASTSSSSSSGKAHIKASSIQRLFIDKIKGTGSNEMNKSDTVKSEIVLHKEKNTCSPMKKKAQSCQNLYQNINKNKKQYSHVESKVKQYITNINSYKRKHRGMLRYQSMPETQTIKSIDQCNSDCESDNFLRQKLIEKELELSNLKEKFHDIEISFLERNEEFGKLLEQKETFRLALLMMKDQISNENVLVNTNHSCANQNDPAIIHPSATMNIDLNENPDSSILRKRVTSNPRQLETVAVNLNQHEHQESIHLEHLSVDSEDDSDLININSTTSSVILDCRQLTKKNKTFNKKLKHYMLKCIPCCKSALKNEDYAYQGLSSGNDLNETHSSKLYCDSAL